MDFNDTLEKRLNDPEFCRELLAELQNVVKQNVRIRNTLKRIVETIDDLNQHLDMEDSDEEAV